MLDWLPDLVVAIRNVVRMDMLFNKLFSEILECQCPSPFLSTKEGSYRRGFTFQYWSAVNQLGNQFTFIFTLRFEVKLSITFPSLSSTCYQILRQGRQPLKNQGQIPPSGYTLIIIFDAHKVTNSESVPNLVSGGRRLSSPYTGEKKSSW